MTMTSEQIAEARQAYNQRAHHVKVLDEAIEQGYVVIREDGRAVTTEKYYELLDAESGYNFEET